MPLSGLSVFTIACLYAAAPAAIAPLTAASGAGAPSAMSAPAPVVIAQAEAAEPQPAPAIEPAPALAQASAPPVFADLSDDAVVDKVFAYLDTLDTLSADFTQYAPSGAISSGRFYLRRPGLLRFEYEPPSPILIVANGGMVFVRDDALETTDSYPVNQTPLKFLLRKKIELGDAEVVGVDRGADYIAVTLASNDEETEGMLTVVLNAPDLSLAEWAVRDEKGGVTVVTLADLEVGGSLQNSLFRVPETDSPFLKN